MSIKVSGGGGGGGASYPGVSGDGQTPGGLKVAGEVQTPGDGSGFAAFPDGSIVSGVVNTSAYPSSLLYGRTRMYDNQGSQADGQDTLQVHQSADLTGDHTGSVLSAYRDGAQNGHDYTVAVVYVEDDSTGTGPAMQVFKNGATQLQVDGDGVRIHGKLKSGSSVAHSLGSYSGNSVPIYDESGTLLGYMPLYA